MSAFWRVIATFLLALWVPCTAHCAIEQLALGSDCCAEAQHGGERDCQDCAVCQAVEGGSYFSPLKRATFALPVAQPVSPPPTLDSIHFAATWRKAAEHIPPELPRVWQFVLRAALPIRAPSVAS
ncbi:MAG: hypothetical protein L0Y58_19875 [Verrucomicrobia subdivision 3 bacterium]|nr:hypothetical protein [Limisphaerales bacterium]